MTGCKFRLAVTLWLIWSAAARHIGLPPPERVTGLARPSGPTGGEGSRAQPASQGERTAPRASHPTPAPNISHSFRPALSSSSSFLPGTCRETSRCGEGPAPPAAGQRSPLPGEAPSKGSPAATRGGVRWTSARRGRKTGENARMQPRKRNGRVPKIAGRAAGRSRQKS